MANSAGYLPNPGFCFVPDGLALPNNETLECPSAHKVLVSFLIYGVISIAINIVLGYGPVRRLISLFDRDKALPDPLCQGLFMGKRRYSHRHSNFQWCYIDKWKSDCSGEQPIDFRYPSIFPGIATAVLHVCFATGAAGILIQGGFKADFGSLLLLWLTRPRFGFLPTLAMFAANWKYGELLFDQFLAEAIIEVVAIPFGMKFIDRPVQSASICNGVELTSSQKGMWSGMTGAGRMFIATGLFQLFALALYAILRYQHSRSGTAQMYSGQTQDRARSVQLIMAAAWVVTFMTFFTSWIFWGLFLKLAGSAYCPSSVLKVSILIAFLSVAASIVRAWSSL